MNVHPLSHLTRLGCWPSVLEWKTAGELVTSLRSLQPSGALGGHLGEVTVTTVPQILYPGHCPLNNRTDSHQITNFDYRNSSLSAPNLHITHQGNGLTPHLRTTFTASEFMYSIWETWKKLFILIMFLEFDLSTPWVSRMTSTNMRFQGPFGTRADCWSAPSDLPQPRHFTFMVCFLTWFLEAQVCRFSSWRRGAPSGPLPTVVQVLHSTRGWAGPPWWNHTKCLPVSHGFHPGPVVPQKDSSNSHKSGVELVLALGVCCPRLIILKWSSGYNALHLTVPCSHLK